MKITVPLFAKNLTLSSFVFNTITQSCLKIFVHLNFQVTLVFFLPFLYVMRGHVVVWISLHVNLITKVLNLITKVLNFINKTKN